MWEAHWLGLGVFGTLWTVIWIYAQPYERVYFSAGMSFIAFSTMALTAPGVERVTESGAIVAAPVSEELQLVTALLAVLSLVVLFLYRLDEYPPPDFEKT